MNVIWKGVIPAVTTKLTSGNTLDMELFDLRLQAQTDAGVDGIISGAVLVKPVY